MATCKFCGKKFNQYELQVEGEEICRECARARTKSGLPKEGRSPSKPLALKAKPRSSRAGSRISPATSRPLVFQVNARDEKKAEVQDDSVSGVKEKIDHLIDRSYREQKAVADATYQNMKDNLAMFYDSYIEGERFERHLASDKFTKQVKVETLQFFAGLMADKYGARGQGFFTAEITENPSKDYPIKDYMQRPMLDLAEMWKEHELDKEEKDAISFIRYALDVDKQYPEIAELTQAVLFRIEDSRIQRWLPPSKSNMKDILRSWFQEEIHDDIVTGMVFTKGQRVKVALQLKKAGKEGLAGSMNFWAAVVNKVRDRVCQGMDPFAADTVKHLQSFFKKNSPTFKSELLFYLEDSAVQKFLDKISEEGFNWLGSIGEEEEDEKEVKRAGRIEPEPIVVKSTQFMQRFSNFKDFGIPNITNFQKPTTKPEEKQRIIAEWKKRQYTAKGTNIKYKLQSYDSDEETLTFVPVKS